jgi:hypothetical protein
MGHLSQAIVLVEEHPPGHLPLRAGAVLADSRRIALGLGRRVAHRALATLRV